MSVLRLAVPSPLRRYFDYLPPPSLSPAECAALRPGVRLTVPFGRQQLTGVLAAVADTSELAAEALKSAVALLDPEPLIAPTLLAIAGQQAGAMLLYEAALSYLGLGVPAGTITWGGMVADARETAQTAWWATVVPGVAIVLVVIGFNATSAVISRRLLSGRSTRRRA